MASRIAMTGDKTMKTRTLLLLVAVVALAAVASFVLVKRTSSPGKIKVGYVSTGISGLAVEIMKDQKLPERHGLQIEFIGFTDPSAMNNAFIEDGFDINLAAGAN